MQTLVSGFFDIHHHIVYGIDDGPSDFPDMVKMLKAAYNDGIDAIVATSHMYPGIRKFDEDKYKTRLGEARKWLKRNDMPLSLYEGAEVLFTPQLGQMLWDGRIPKMNGTDYILLEFVPGESLDTIEAGIKTVVRNGALPIIAHVERVRSLMFHPKKILELKKSYEAMLQINCSCVLEKRDLVTSITLNRLLSDGEIDFMATDAHNTTTRRVHMSEAYDKVSKKYGEAYADKLTGRI